MDSIASDELLARARSVGFRPDAVLGELIEVAIARATDDADLGKLFVAKAITFQGQGGAGPSAEASCLAVAHLVAAGDTALATFASAMAAVFLDQSGNLPVAIEYAVDAFVMLDKIGIDEVDDVDTVRAMYAVSGFFMRLSAFDLAIDLSHRAFLAVLDIPGVPVEPVACSFGYFAAEYAHITDDDVERERLCGMVVSAAEWLRENGVTDLSREMVYNALIAEVDLANGGNGGELAILEEAENKHFDAAPDLRAWHRAVLGMSALRHGDAAKAVVFLDLAIPGLEASSDNHLLVRALETRSLAKAATNDLAGALDDSTHLARLVRSWQLTQVSHLAHQVTRRADLERTSETLRVRADLLAAHVDHDDLTGVYSRRWLDRRIESLVNSDAVGSIAMLDIDKFKVVNDTYGHSIGDEVLRRFGALLSSAFGSQYEVARYGGEEFVVIIDEDDPAVVLEGCERFRLEVAAHDWSSIAECLELTVSAGSAYGRLSDVATLLRVADEALLTAKRNGRNRVVSTQPTAVAP